jgi:hypothetical protein
MPKGGCQNCNMPNQNLKRCKHEDIKRYSLFNFLPKSATDWVDG